MTRLALAAISALLGGMAGAALVLAIASPVCSSTVAMVAVTAGLRG